MIGLIVPESSEAIHLEILRQITAILKDKEQYQQLEHAQNNEALYQAMLLSAATHANTQSA